MIRDYSSNYHIKDFFINQIAPKLFDLEDVNQFSVGLLGYVTEMGSTTTEDAFNAMNIYIKETHASRATMADTIYTNAAIYSVDNIHGKSAAVRAFLFIKEDDIIEKGEAMEDRYVFTFDSNSEIQIGGVSYALDYDIIISARPYRGDYQFLSQYDMSLGNSNSKVTHPYLKTHRMTMEGVKYIGVDVYLMQYKRIVVEENILVDTSLTIPVISVPFENQLANIDVYYRKPGGSDYIQLEKRMEGTVPSIKPFFFYTMKDENVLEISFTSREKYFQPEYNSDLKIVAYTTVGTEGNFKEYTGSDVRVVIDNPKFDYMTQIIPFISPSGPSTGGVDALPLEDIRVLTVENMAVSGAYNTEDDITLFFRNYTDIHDMHITFIRKRDDLVERLFTGFILMKDEMGDYYHTNTLNTRLKMSDFDEYSETLGRYILHPGRVFTYDGDSKTKTKIHPKDVRSINAESEEQFVYTNPFLITFQENPNNVSYYINTIDDSLAVDFIYANELSHIQFIVNSMTIKRNAIAGEDSYKFTVKMRPTKTIAKREDGEWETKDRIRVALTFEDKDKTESRALILHEESYSEKDNIFTFVGEMKTKDIISSDGRVLVEDIYNLDNAEFGEHMIRMHDLITNINVFYDLGKPNNDHALRSIEDFGLFTLVNKYCTETVKTNLIVPFNFIRSRMNYGVYLDDNPEGGDPIPVKYIDVYQVPMVASHHVTDTKSLLDFVREIKTTYYTLREITKEKTSNYNIDLKFYNTYGRSLNFTRGEDTLPLDRTNIKFHIQVKPTVNALVDELFSDIKEYIKDYIENVNQNISENIGVRGYNAIYVSNLIQELENNFSNLSYMKFVRINEYDSSVQVIENNTVDTEEMSLAQRRDYIPEFLTIRLEDIQVDLLSR